MSRSPERKLLSGTPFGAVSARTIPAQTAPSMIANAVTRSALARRFLSKLPFRSARGVAPLSCFMTVSLLEMTWTRYDIKERSCDHDRNPLLHIQNTDWTLLPSTLWQSIYTSKYNVRKGCRERRADKMESR